MGVGAEHRLKSMLHAEAYATSRGDTRMLSVSNCGT
jgi:hypothetical protein